MDFGVVRSPCYGTIEKISIKNAMRIYEWETLFVIRTEEGHKELIQMGVSGEISSLEVQEGDAIIPGMVLAYMKEDLFVTGSD